MSGKVVLEGHIKVPSAQLEFVKIELEEHIKRTRQEEGCLVVQIQRRSNDPTVFDVYEEFIDKTAFEYHQSRVKNSRWGEFTKDVERQYTVTETGVDASQV